ncbi:hypothetical protein AK812_SmicGene2972 [Symbiodinium microadriaticum]|uniref:Uncharacterized protein n=1 Tax=Symbiodinium microadriaticum TaxID=2951 RepID=A0A1Q9F0A3_SYMMI|nr:hypothetical protein AK812_SmicGene2972 [Symbiodinium microadriaticum]
MTARMMLMLTLVLRAIVDYDDHDNAMTLWAWDIVQIGSAPIQTKPGFHGRLAADLPHHMFVLSAVLGPSAATVILVMVLDVRVSSWLSDVVDVLFPWQVLWIALVAYFLFGVIGAMWHENKILHKALLKVNYHPAVAPPPMQAQVEQHIVSNSSFIVG